MPRAKPQKPTSQQLVDMLLKKQSRVRIPHVADISASFIAAMGGAVAFGAQLVTDYNEAMPGSMTRAKIIDLVLRGLKGEHDEVDISKLGAQDLHRILAAQTEEYGALLSDATEPATEPATEGSGEAAKGQDASQGSAGEAGTDEAAATSKAQGYSPSGAGVEDPEEKGR